MFIVLLSSIANASNHTKCVSLSNQNYMIQPTLINLHPNECSHRFHYYPFSVKLDRCAGSCNPLNPLWHWTKVGLMTYLKKYVFQIKQDLNLNVFNMITGINELETLTKHVSCECKFKFDGRSCNSDQ